MEPSFTSVRQMVADRVLDRHLRDLADKHVGMEMPHKQRDIHLMERDLLAGTQRNRQGGASAPLYSSMASPSELPRPTSRRHSLPPTDPPLTAHTPKHHMPKPTPHTRDIDIDRPHKPEPGEDPAGRPETGQSADESPSTQHSPPGKQYPGDSRLETSQAGTRTAGESRTRGVLKLATTPSDARAEIAVTGSQTSTKVTLNDGVHSLDPRGPALERGETFVKTDTYQVLSFQDVSGDSSDESSEETSAAVTGSSMHGDIRAANALLSTAKRTRRGSLTSQHSGRSGAPSAASEILRQAPLLSRRRSVHVTVPTAGSEEGLPGVTAQTQRRRSSGHVDGTGLLEGDDGGFTPQSLRLPLHLLHDESNECDNDNKGNDTSQSRRKKRGKRGKRGGIERVMVEKEDVNDDENTRKEAM